MDAAFYTGLIAIAFGAGFLGSMLGIGGGVLMVPLFSLVLHLPLHVAIGTSLISVVATATAGANVYLQRRWPDMRIAMFLEIPTVLGAIAGGLLAARLNQEALSLIFAFVAFYTAWNMAFGRSKKEASGTASQTPAANPQTGTAKDKSTPILDFSGEYYDPVEKRMIPYTARRVPFGLAMSVFGGMSSGLLGIGGGVIKVPIMRLAMGLPLKVATATSNFMVGLTAVASAIVYFAGGFIQPMIAAPTTLAVLIGASVGARFVSRVDNRTLAKVFAVVLAGLAVQMAARGLSMFGS